MKLGGKRPPLFLTLGFYLVILGFWSLFLETIAPSSFRFFNIPFHLLFFNTGAIALLISMSIHFRREENLRNELQRTRNLLSFIFQHIPDHVYVKDRQSRFVGASMSLVRHFGLQKIEEILGKTDFDFFSTPHAEEAFTDEQRIMESGIPIVGKEEKETWPDGSINWVSTSKIPWKDTTGEVIGIIGISRDITPLVVQRRKLEENERFLTVIFENIQDGLCVLDREMNIIRANRFLEKMYPEEYPLVGKKCYQAFYRAEHPCVDCPTLKALAAGESRTATVPYMRMGKHVGWLEVIAHPLYDEHGSIQGIIEQVRNITERVQYEEELKTREENFRLFAESNPSAILIYQDNRFIYANTEAERLTGYSREELIGMPVTHFIHPDFVSTVATRAERRQRNLPVEKQYEIKIITKDWQERWLFLSAETILYQGRWAGLVAAMDITEKKNAERKNLHLKMVLQSIRDVNQILSRERELPVILEKVCQAMVQDEAYTSTLIRLVNEENPFVFHAGIEKEKLCEWITFLERTDFSLSGETPLAIPLHCSPPEESLLAVPIRYRERLLGTLAVAMPSDLAQEPEEQELLLELSDDLAFGIHNLEIQKTKDTIQKSLVESERRFRTLVENLPLGVIIFRNGEFVYSNPFADQLLDHFVDPFLAFLKEKTHTHQAISLPGTFTIEDEVHLANHRGEERWFLIRGRSIQYEGQASLLLFLLDITEKKRHEQVIEYLATHDALTGLYNRAFFEKTIQEVGPEQLPASIIMGDLNGLKLVNDAFGHETGDRLLIKAASLLSESCPPGGIVARVGGDEFAMLLPRTDHTAVQQLVEDMYRKFANQAIQFIPISISLGFGTKIDATQSMYDILRIAENWMYQRKLIDGPKFRVETVHILQRTLRETAFEAEEHTNHIKELALRMAQILNLSEKEKELLSLLADFHDVGKITIPQEILQKPGPLSQEEWEIIRRHPEVGFRIAQAIPVLAPIANLVLAHHEWYNGQGYPRGLKGEEIPLLARLIAICDAFDVMVSSRPYKRTLLPEEAITELQRYSGTQFDPTLVAIFVEIFTKDCDDFSRKT
ncbi:MAG: PAS domain S-box protein [Candidatus Atribacteria bacterium]|nr:PAS domain S-box protein [Candidatus Atribacteria bacterium]